MRSIKSSGVKQEGSIGRYVDINRLIVPEKARKHMGHKPFEVVRKGTK